MTTMRTAAAHSRLRSPATWAALLAGLTAGSLCVLVVLTVLAGDPRLSGDGGDAVIVLSFAAVGFVVARRQPANPIGWVLLACALSTALLTDAKLYAVLDYRIHHGSLPLGAAAAFWVDAFWPLDFLIGTTALILFPDGRMPSPRWRRVMWAYLVTSALWLAGQVTGTLDVIVRHPLRVDATGTPIASPTGLAGVLFGISWLFAAPLPLIWLAWVGRQITTYRSAADLRREQLKWLTGGALVCVTALMVTLLSTNAPAERALADISALAIAAFPVCMGVAILRHRLYEIDRIISRTLAYAIVTGLLLGVYAGLVLLATNVLGVKGPVTVAAATLAAAALFAPLRRQVQHIVDRRFNRARYDADQMLAVFSARLKDAVDIDTVRDDLLSAVYRTLEPAHAAVWMIGGDR
jgi:hypothetical protein